MGKACSRCFRTPPDLFCAGFFLWSSQSQFRQLTTTYPLKSSCQHLCQIPGAFETNTEINRGKGSFSLQRPGGWQLQLQAQAGGLLQCTDQSWVPPLGFWGRVCPLPFSRSWRHLPSSAHEPLPPSSSPATVSSLLCPHDSLAITRRCLPGTKDPCDELGPPGYSRITPPPPSQGP